MKILRIILCLGGALVAGCAHREAATAVQVAPAQEHVERAESLTGQAQATAAKIGRQIGAAGSDASRIDDKAAVLLEHWQ